MKKLKLIPNARRVFLTSWANLLNLLSGLLISVELVRNDLVELLAVLEPYLEPGVALVCGLVVKVLVPFARIVRQTSLHPDDTTKDAQ